MDGDRGSGIAEPGTTGAMLVSSLPCIDLAVSYRRAGQSHRRHDAIQATEVVKLVCCDAQA